GQRNRGLRFAGRLGVIFGYLLGALGLYQIARGDLFGLWSLILGWILAQAARGAILQGTVRDRLEQVTVGEIMDPRPVTIDGDLTLLEAQERVFEHHDWPFVGVIDADHRFLGVLTREKLESEVAAGRPALKVRELIE